MLELSFAYLISAALIAGLVFLAIGNRKQGWQKERGVWQEVQATAAIAAFETRAEAPLVHFNDLVRLQQSLAHDSEGVPVESVKR
jgi:hypothetical protein